MNSMPERVAVSAGRLLSAGYGFSPSGRFMSGWNTTVPQSGHFSSLSFSSTPHFMQYICIRLSFLSRPFKPDCSPRRR
jgi:hypothetical protein